MMPSSPTRSPLSNYRLYKSIEIAGDVCNIGGVAYALLAFARISSGDENVSPGTALWPMAILVALYLLFRVATGIMERHDPSLRFGGNGFDAGDLNRTVTELRNTLREIQARPDLVAPSSKYEIRGTIEPAK